MKVRYSRRERETERLSECAHKKGGTNKENCENVRDTLTASERHTTREQENDR